MFTGTITSLSFSGALIIKVDVVPPEGTLLVLTFQTEKGQVRLKGKLMSTVVHSGWAIRKELGVGLFGIEFQEPIQKIKEKLTPVLQPLSDKDD